MNMVGKCVHLKHSWNEIKQSLDGIYRIKIYGDPIVCLIDDGEPYSIQKGKEIINILFFALLLLFIIIAIIPLKWMSSELPSNLLWVQNINRAIGLEKTDYIKLNRI